MRRLSHSQKLGGYAQKGNVMNAVELEKELWEINNELVKAGIKPHEHPTMASAVAELRGQYNRYKALFNEAVADRDRLLDEQAAQPSVQSDGGRTMSLIESVEKLNVLAHLVASNARRR